MFIDCKNHAVEEIRQAAMFAASETRREEARLRAMGEVVIGPVGHFVRAVRAGWVAFWHTLGI